jgi:hypothetical protein
MLTYADVCEFVDTIFTARMEAPVLLNCIC